MGTYGSELYILKNSGDAKTLNFTEKAERLVCGHYTPNQHWTNEIWGLALHPLDPDIYATCSDDATVRIWSFS